VDPVADIIAWLMPFGMLGLFAAASFERLVPVLPSYVLLVAIGVGASREAWGFVPALAAVTAGSVLGCAALFRLSLAIGEARLRRIAAFCGLPGRHIDRLMGAFLQRQWQFSLLGQLTPGLRLVMPGVAGLLGAKPSVFLCATALGVLAWNLIFLLGGYAAGTVFHGVSATALALKLALGVLAFDAILLVVLRASSPRRQSSQAHDADPLHSRSLTPWNP
jgi:membrane protein DedA with SNARE-associated domain